jgi:tRNA G37 N-methylase TrmD
MIEGGLAMGLGDDKAKFLFISQGWIPPMEMRRMALRLVELVGMTPARHHQIDDYPYRGGGGNGYTLFQPLMESYLVADVYYDRNETEILISTCIPERLVMGSVMSFLENEIGPTTGGRMEFGVAA